MDYLRYVAYAVALIGVALKRRFVLEQGRGVSQYVVSAWGHFFRILLTGTRAE